MGMIQMEYHRSPSPEACWVAKGGDGDGDGEK